MTDVSVVRPPYRAEHVGSFPRPERLLRAREDFAQGRLPRAAFKAIEAACIRDVVAMQERAGIGAITDGEYPKTGWREFLWEKCEGFGDERAEGVFEFTKFDGQKRKPTGDPKVVSRLRRREPLSAGDFEFLRSSTARPIKANLPAPSIAHMSGDQVFHGSVYRDRDELFADLVQIMREEIADLAGRGCTYLQMDEVPIAILCDPANRERVRQRGEDPDRLIETYVAAINQSLAAAPPTMTVCVHMCRGNIGHGMADGGYDYIAERVFGTLAVHGYFLEYDTPRAGDFGPLRFMPKDKRVVLGLVSSKAARLEPADELKSRIDQAARHLALEQLCLSPQCGFSSVAANRGLWLSLDDVERKLARVVEVADDMWG
jgi:5-methyltetrahydropteroyltriglutamate--homocysteine methyltransferase